MTVDQASAKPGINDDTKGNVVHASGWMAPKIQTDDSEPPIIDVLVESLSWNEIDSYVRVSRRFLLVEVPDTGQYRGVYRNGSGIATTDDLGTDREAAVKQYRDILRQPGS